MAQELVKSFEQNIQESLQLKAVDAANYSGLSLAYAGDGVFELIVRLLIMNKGNMPVQKMHQRTSSIVKAVSQAKMMDGLLAVLTEEEEGIYRRGRNSKPHTMAKNASSVEYKKATGFEALVGYLYLTGRYERLMELVKMGLEQIGEL
jgi:ribonuclease-3 family protein